MIVEYSEDIYPYATFQLEESVPAGGDSRCNSAAPLQTFVPSSLHCRYSSVTRGTILFADLCY